MFDDDPRRRRQLVITQPGDHTQMIEQTGHDGSSLIRRRDNGETADIGEPKRLGKFDRGTRNHLQGVPTENRAGRFIDLPTTGAKGRAVRWHKLIFGRHYPHDTGHR